MLTLAYLVAIPILVAALTAAHTIFWTRVYRRPRFPDEVHYTEADDGWRIALSRIRADEGGVADGALVICCPGLACNARLFDFDDEHSLAHFLAACGFDVWMLDPRGMGASERPAWFGRSWDYGIGDYVRRDAPAAVEYVLETAAREGKTPPGVFWIGHSMGGLIGYRLGLDDHAHHLLGVVAVGSPFEFGGHTRDFAAPAWFFDRVLRRWPVARLGRAARFFAPFAGMARLRQERWFLSPENLSVRALRHFMAEVLEDVSRRVLNAFVDAVRRRASLGGRSIEDARRDMERFDRPALMIAGSVDHCAPPAAVLAAGESMSSSDSSSVVAGRAQGDPVDFGHLDLLIGREAPRIVYPRIADWLLARASMRASESPSTPPSRAAVSATSQPE